MRISLEAATVKYVGRKDAAFSKLSVTFAPGETVLLLGASGCGKSTLALSLNGLVPHSIGATLNGSVSVDGLDTRDATVAELSRKVGIVFQDPEAQFVTLKVEDEIVFGLENLRTPPESMRPLVDAALASVDMPDAHEREVFKLSGGEKQRIALASLLAMEPGVLVFDEPTANLDPVGTRDVFALIAALRARNRHTIILIEHKLDELMHLIDRVIALGDAGAMLADGAPRDVFDRDADVLQAHGIWMPQTCLLAAALRARGAPVTPFPVTLDEAADAFATLSFGPHVPEAAHARSNADAQNAPPAVETRALSCVRGGRVALTEVSLRVAQGEFLAIVGANGAGKSTLAQHLIGVLSAPAGRVLIEGQDIGRIPARQLIERVGYVFQNPEHQFVTDSVQEEVAYGLRVKGLDASETNDRAKAMLERFGLLKLAKANPFTLSHGQKRRLSVATMLAAGQRTLILDEPTFGQDQRNADALMSLLRELHAEGRTIIVITHDMALVAEHARRVAVMASGRVIYDGGTAALFEQRDVMEAARLTPPPVARLAHRVPGLCGALTIDDALRRFELAHAATGT
jgi:energy-coupling factor transport system ATP-binding protein